MRKLVLHTKTAEKTGVVIEHGKIFEYVVDRPGVSTLAGAIFCGKIINIDRGLQAAFVDIGEDKHGFLRKESIPWCQGKIESAIRVGERIYVQGIKDPVGEKGPQMTADLTLPGVYTIYQPFGRKVSLSRKLDGEKGKELEALLTSQLSEREGVIVRTAAGEVEGTTVQEELGLLKNVWSRITEKVNKNPVLLWKEPLIPNQWIRKYPISSIEEIIVDDGTVAQELKKQFPSVSKKIIWKKDVSKEMPVSIHTLQEQLADSTVENEKGVQLVIEQTEAMTVIDVNSHQYKGKALSNSQAFKVNEKAAVEIQRQIRLRNLAGMIIIDFLSMKDPSSQKRLVTKMKKLLNKDPVKTNVFGMTRLGLLEVTRQRSWLSPGTILLKKQEEEFTTETLLFRLERELIEHSQSHMEARLVTVHPDLYRAKKRLLSEPISSRIPQELFVRQDSTINGYQIELEGSLDMIRDAVQRRGYHVDNLF